MTRKRIVNDMVIRFANVNGTGSASANDIVAKSIFRMGIPITPKNIFPSNIQGLPTWYEIRVNEKGYLGRREGLDILMGITPQSFATVSFEGSLDSIAYPISQRTTAF